MRPRSSTAAASACRAPARFPINFGARLSGRVGRYSIGALNIGTDEIASLRHPGDELHRRPRAPRRPAAQHDRRVVHEPVGLDGGGPEATRSSASTPTSRSHRTSASAVTRRSREPRIGRATRSATGRTSPTPPTATACSSIGPWSGTTSIRRSAFSGGAASGATSGRPDSVRGPQRNATIRQYLLREQPRLHHRQSEPARKPHLDHIRANGPAEQRCVSKSSTTREYELLRRAFEPAAGITIPPGTYSFQHVRGSWTPGPAAPAVRRARRRRRRVLRRHQEDGVGQRAVRRDRSVRRRTEHLAELARPRRGSDATVHGGRRPRDLHDDAADVRRGARPALVEQHVGRPRTSGSGGSINPGASCSSCTPTPT